MIRLALAERYRHELCLRRRGDAGAGSSCTFRLTMPWLFTGFFERYWPFVVVGIA